MIFIEWCKYQYLKGNTPGNLAFRKSSEFDEIMNLVTNIVSTEGIKAIYSYTIEGQYLINLWAAHLIIEYFDPPEYMKAECLKIIKHYSKGRLNTDVAMEEQAWLKQNMQP